MYIFIYIYIQYVSPFVKGSLIPLTSTYLEFRMPFMGAIIPLITSRGPFCRNWWGDLFRDDY